MFNFKLLNAGVAYA